MTEVEFSNIEPYNSIITTVECKNSFCNSIKFTNGSINKLNYGKEYKSGINQGGFLYGRSLSILLIDDIKVSEVEMHSDISKTGDYSSLFYLFDAFQIIIRNCIFTNVIGSEGSILNYTNTLSRTATSELNIDHILIENNLFTNIIGIYSGIALKINMQAYHQNIIIRKSIFENNLGYLGNIGLVYIERKDEPSEIDINGDLSLIPRVLTIQECIFNNNLAGEGSVILTNLANIKIFKNWIYR